MNLNWYGVFKNRIAVHNFNFCCKLVNLVSFSKFSKIFSIFPLLII